MALALALALAALCTASASAAAPAAAGDWSELLVLDCSGGVHWGSSQPLWNVGLDAAVAKQFWVWLSVSAPSRSLPLTRPVVVVCIVGLFRVESAGARQVPLPNADR